MTIRLLPIIACALALSACSTFRSGPSGAELVGNSLRMETQRGQVSRLIFRGDGVVRADFGRNSVRGRWEIVDRQLCFHWQGAPRECWPYRSSFERGRTRELTSDRGNRVRVTLL
jgi:hypothetical protein